MSLCETAGSTKGPSDRRDGFWSPHCVSIQRELARRLATCFAQLRWTLQLAATCLDLRRARQSARPDPFSILPRPSCLIAPSRFVPGDTRFRYRRRLPCYALGTLRRCALSSVPASFSPHRTCPQRASVSTDQSPYGSSPYIAPARRAPTPIRTAAGPALRADPSRCLRRPAPYRSPCGRRRPSACRGPSARPS